MMTQIRNYLMPNFLAVAMHFHPHAQTHIPMQSCTSKFAYVPWVILGESWFLLIQHNLAIETKMKPTFGKPLQGSDIQC